MWAVRWFFVLIVLILLILFSIANVEFITSIIIIPGYLEFHDVTVIWIVSLSFIIGMVASFVIAVVKYLQMNVEITKRDRQIAVLQQELTAMRNVPLNEEETSLPETDDTAPEEEQS